MHLGELREHEPAVVVAVHGEGAFRRRLLELGFVPGTEVVRTGQSPLGDPLSFRVRGAVLSLRRTDAALIRVEAR
jgi:Fe2+ transport system protein FeoA